MGFFHWTLPQELWADRLRGWRSIVHGNMRGAWRLVSAAAIGMLPFLFFFFLPFFGSITIFGSTKRIMT
jgi:hypothetical protein